MDMMNLVVELVKSWLMLSIGIIISLVVCVVAHQGGHYLTYLLLGGKPKVSFYLKENKLSEFTPFVTPKDGNAFYFGSLLKNEKTAWKKQILLSGSGLIASLILAMISLVLLLLAIPNGSFELVCLLAFNLIINCLLFDESCKDEASDGWRVIKALKHREKYVDFLIETNYSFDVEDEYMKAAIRKIQDKELKKE